MTSFKYLIFLSLFTLRVASSACEYAPVSVTISRVIDNGNGTIRTPLLYVNKEFSRMSEFPREMCVGVTCKFVQSPIVSDSAQVDKLNHHLQSAKPVNAIIGNIKRSGEAFRNVLYLRPVFSGPDKLYSFVIGTQYEMINSPNMEKLEHDLFIVSALVSTLPTEIP